MIQKGKSHAFSDEGTYFVDALDCEITTGEKNIVGNIIGFFKNKEERLSSKEDKLVSEDLEKYYGSIKACSILFRLSSFGS